MLDVENRTQIPNVSPPGVLKSILRVSVINVGEVTCWAVAPGPLSLNLITTNAVFNPEWIPGYPHISPGSSPFLFSVCLLRHPTTYKLRILFFLSFVSFLFKSPSTKNCVYFCPLTPTEIFLLKIQNDCAFISFSASQNIKIPAAQ